MKRWMRTILAVLLGALAVSYLGTAPVQAAETETVVTYRGYTVTWSEPDASDLKVVRTPGRVESFPAKASDRSIRHAKVRVTEAASQQVSEDPTDSCSFVPDSFGAANFGPACATHDACYSSNVDRLTCDLILLRQLIQACNVYPEGSSLRTTCYTVASIYFVGVRLFGWIFYSGGGSAL